MTKSIKPQLSLFSNANCTQCGKKIKEGFVYCKPCEGKWIEKHLKPKENE
jgi:hypothetical protein